MSAPRSVLAGLIGAGIQASRTPALHEREATPGIRYLYRLIDLDPLGKSRTTWSSCSPPPATSASPG